MDNFRSFLESIAISCHFYFLQSDSRSPFQTAAVFQNGTMRGSSFFSFRLTPFSTYFSLMLRIRSRILRMPVGISVNSLPFSFHPPSDIGEVSWLSSRSCASPSCLFSTHPFHKRLAYTNK